MPLNIGLTKKNGASVDLSDANASAGDVIASKTFYAGDNSLKTGSMIDNGTASADINNVDDEIIIAAGKHSGSGIVKISAIHQGKIIPENIKKDINILGVIGSLEASAGGSISLNVLTLTSSGVWTKPNNLLYLDVICIGGGGGGASGSKTASGIVARAGAGGSQGCIAWDKIDASQLSATENYVVGLGGPGGAEVTNDNTNGLTGSNGQDSYFGGTDYSSSKVYAQGGYGGYYNSAGASRLITGQKPATAFVSGSGGASSSSGGNGSNPTSQNVQGNYNTISGGGAGGGINSSNILGNGSAGALYYNADGDLSTSSGGIANATPGSDGIDNYMNRIPYVLGKPNTLYENVLACMGTPGGGGAAGLQTSGPGTRGGDGGLYGGAGGGGGSIRNGAMPSGRGGNGANGVIVLIEYLVS